MTFCESVLPSYSGSADLFFSAVSKARSITAGCLTGDFFKLLMEIGIIGKSAGFADFRQ